MKFDMEDRNRSNTKQMASWKEGMAVTNFHVFDRFYIFAPYLFHDCQGTLPTICRSTEFS